jgi:hypothetical protein
LIDVGHAPIATEFCVAEKFRDVPASDIAGLAPLASVGSTTANAKGDASDGALASALAEGGNDLDFVWRGAERS